MKEEMEALDGDKDPREELQMKRTKLTQTSTSASICKPGGSYSELCTRDFTHESQFGLVHPVLSDAGLKETMMELKITQEALEQLCSPNLYDETCHGTELYLSSVEVTEENDRSAETASLVSGASGSTIVDFAKDETSRTNEVQQPLDTISLSSDASVSTIVDLTENETLIPMTAGQPTPRNKARKSIKSKNSGTTVQQINLLAERGLITPKVTTSQCDDPLPGTSRETPSLCIDNTPNSFESQREHAKVSLMTRLTDSPQPSSQRNLFIPETNFVVDSFTPLSHNATAFFLTSFKLEHLRNLRSSFNKPLYCSAITAQILQSFICEPASSLIRPMQTNESYIVEGIEVTALDSKHSPGSVMFLFKTFSGKSILYTGPFRASSRTMTEWSKLLPVPISQVFIDTTFCYQGWNFPPTQCVLSYIKQLVCKKAKIFRTKLLCVIACGATGHEQIIKLVAKAMRSKVWAPPLKQCILNCIGDAELSRHLTPNPSLAQIHLITEYDANPKNLLEYLRASNPKRTSMLAIHPSGWHLTKSLSKKNALPAIPVRKFGNVELCELPYSNHSGYKELRKFVKKFQPQALSSTESDSSEKQRKRIQNLFDSWLEI